MAWAPSCIIWGCLAWAPCWAAWAPAGSSRAPAGLPGPPVGLLGPTAGLPRPPPIVPRQLTLVLLTGEDMKHMAEKNYTQHVIDGQAGQVSHNCLYAFEQKTSIYIGVDVLIVNIGARLPCFSPAQAATLCLQTSKPEAHLKSQAMFSEPLGFRCPNNVRTSCSPKIDAMHRKVTLCLALHSFSRLFKFCLTACSFSSSGRCTVTQPTWA